MKYQVKEIYYTLQGEGGQTGRPMVFCRFAGCNLWSGREEDRDSAVCRFCDTDFVGVDGPTGGVFDTPKALSEAVLEQWPKETRLNGNGAQPWVVCTGGEPLLQLDQPLVEAFHAVGLKVAVETNGTLPSPTGVDWLTVSPKAGTELAVTAGQELKLVFPQPGAEPELFEDLSFEHFFLQPMDGPKARETTQETLRYCLRNPRWRLSLQTHKWLGIE